MLQINFTGDIYEITSGTSRRFKLTTHLQYMSDTYNTQINVRLILHDLFVIKLKEMILFSIDY